MSNSFEEWLREVASSVGLTEEQLAKAVGAVVLNSICARARRNPTAEMQRSCPADSES